MKKLMKSVACGLLVTAMALASLTGCSGKKDTTKEQGTSATKEKAKLSILTYAMADNEYSSKMPVLDEIAKRTNTEIDWQNLPYGAEKEKIDLIFASGKLPDVLIWPGQDKVTQYAKDGAVIPLEDLVEKYGPNIKSTFAKMEKEIIGFKGRVYSADGHLYNIPSFTSSGANAGMVWSIREDWCKNVGLKVPTTTDELYTVLKAFKEKDPNKNGQADELPMISRNANYYLTFLVNSFGVVNGLYWDEKAQEIKYGPTTPEYKEAITYINKLYTEGLIDPEYITNTDDQFKAKMADNRAGMMLGSVNSHVAALHDSLKTKNKDFNLVPMLPVKGPRGDAFKQGASSLIQFRGSITKSCKNPEAAIKLFDYCFSPEGSDLLAWGIEGKTYAKVGDKKQILDYVNRNPDGLEPMQVVNAFGIDACLPHQYNSESYFALSSPFVASIYKLYSADPKILQEEIQGTISLTADEANETKKYTDAFKYMSPIQAGFITGKEPLSKWDEYVAQAEKLGIKKFTDVYTKAYKRQNGIK